MLNLEIKPPRIKKPNTLTLKLIKMKNLKVILLFLTLGFVGSISASTNLNLVNTVGPMTTFKAKTEKIAALDVVGNHKYYLKYSNNRGNFKKNQEQEEENKELPLTCSKTETIKETC